MELWDLSQIVETINIKPTNAKILEYLRWGWFLTETKTQLSFRGTKRKAQSSLKTSNGEE